MKRPLERITVDDCALDLVALARRRKAKRVMAHIATDLATGKVLTLRVEHFGARLSAPALARVESLLRAQARR